MKIGYARVSTEDQKLDLQHDALRAAGCDVVHGDKLSGVAKRPGLMAALNTCKAGDVLVVWKLDRLGRSMQELVAIANDLRGRDVHLKILTGEGATIDTTQPSGRFFYHMMAAFAEFDREIMVERTVAGLAVARRRGKRLGPPVKLTPEKIDMARRLIAEGKGKRVTARMSGVHPPTLREALNGRADRL